MTQDQIYSPESLFCTTCDDYIGVWSAIQVSTDKIFCCQQLQLKHKAYTMFRNQGGVT